MKSLCVFCGSSTGISTIYADAARHLASALVERDLTLVFGGGHIGLMGVLADTVLAAGGRAIGVIPGVLVDRELAHRGCELRIVGSMHERKAVMAEISDGFIALPGGFGTLDELFEILTWAQLGIHTKPMGLLNVAGYFELLLSWLDQAVREQFVTTQDRALLISEAEPERLLDRLVKWRHTPPTALQPVRP
jgi:uncharacterized protein (TIGR00730 family)